MSDCMMLQMLPDSFSCLTQLEGLNLNRRRRPQEFPYSLGNLTRLRKLQLYHCEQPKGIPESWGHLNLQLPSGGLRIRGCTQLKSLPESLGEMDFIRSLAIERSGIEYLPQGIGLLSNLQSLVVFECALRELKFTNALTAVGEGQASNSKKSELSNDNSIHGCIPGLKSIVLYRTKVSEISISENCCPKLESLDLPGKILVSMDALPTTAEKYKNL
eukprot:Gb_12645 [translate_table: standard]